MQPPRIPGSTITGPQASTGVTGSGTPFGGIEGGPVSAAQQALSLKRNLNVRSNRLGLELGLHNVQQAQIRAVIDSIGR